MGKYQFFTGEGVCGCVQELTDELAGLPEVEIPENKWPKSLLEEKQRNVSLLGAPGLTTRSKAAISRLSRHHKNRHTTPQHAKQNTLHIATSMTRDRQQHSPQKHITF